MSNNTYPRPLKETTRNVLELWVQKDSGEGVPRMRGDGSGWVLGAQESNLSPTFNKPRRLNFSTADLQMIRAVIFLELNS